MATTKQMCREQQLSQWQQKEKESAELWKNIQYYKDRLEEHVHELNEEFTQLYNRRISQARKLIPRMFGNDYEKSAQRKNATGFLMPMHPINPETNPQWMQNGRLVGAGDFSWLLRAPKIRKNPDRNAHQHISRIINGELEITVPPTLFNGNKTETTYRVPLWILQLSDSEFAQFLRRRRKVYNELLGIPSSKEQRQKARYREEINQELVQARAQLREAQKQVEWLEARIQLLP